MKKTILLVIMITGLFLGSNAQTYTIGAGATTNTGTGAATDYPAPYNNKNRDVRNQFLILASELTAAGATAGNITNIAFDVLAVNSSNNALGTFTIQMGLTVASSLTTTFITAGLTTVYSGAYTPTTGWNTHTFTSCFNWDGISNVVVNTCYPRTAAGAGTGATTYWTTGLGFNASCFYGISSFTACTQATGTVSTSRPNMQLTIDHTPDIAALSIVSPANGSTMPLFSTFPITINIGNQKCVPITSAIVGYRLNNGPFVTAAWAGNLAPGANVNYTFTPNETAVFQGNNTLKVWATTPNATYPDANTANDTLNSVGYFFFVQGPNIDTSGYNGKNFWIGYMANWDNGASGPANNNLLLNVAAINGANVTVTAPNLTPSLISTFTVPAGGIHTISVPTTIGGVQMRTPNDEVISNTGINVVADQPVSVTGVNLMTASTDGFLAIPSNNLGTQYIAFAPIGIYNPTGSQQAPSEFMIVATQNNTIVTITPSQATRTKPAGIPIIVTLNKGQTYLLTGNLVPNTAFVGNNGSNNDLTGSYISSTKPIVVYGGSQCSTVPWLGTTIGGVATCAACNHLVEELPPITSWGTHYLLGHLAIKTAPDVVRIISSFAGTTNLTYNGVAYTLPAAGAFVDVLLPNGGGAEIIANHNIFAIQLSMGTSCDAVANSDPMTIGMVPEVQWGIYYPFNTPNVPYFANNNYINIIKKGLTSTVIVDNIPVPAASFAQIGTSGYYFTQYLITNTAITHLALGSAPFVCYSYGFDNADAYGYPASGGSLYNTLPISLVDFSGKPIDNNKAVKLDWVTATEVNNNYFLVERSTDGQTYAPISSQIQGAGNSSILKSYSFIDEHPLNGANYYRLKQVDFNGDHKYSSIVNVDIVNLLNGFTVLPVPSKDKVNIRFNSSASGEMNVNVYDITGREVIHLNNNTVSEGGNEVAVDISNLNDGAYFLYVNSSTGQQLQAKIIKE